MTNKWEHQSGSARPRPIAGNIGTNNYTPRYARAPAKFSPKQAVRSFRDLEVYQRMMECAVLFGKHIAPALRKQGYPLLEGMQNTALSAPLYIAEAHGLRFSDFDHAVATLERAMQACNKMIVYLEQVVGLYEKLDADLAADLSSRYMQTRGKMLRLSRSWQKFRAGPVSNFVSNGAGGPG